VGKELNYSTLTSANLTSSLPPFFCSSVFNNKAKPEADVNAEIIGIVGSCERRTKPKSGEGTPLATNDLRAKALCFDEEEETKDVAHFRNLLQRTTETLDEFCKLWETKLSASLPEEAVGNIRSAIGKARLLTNAKGRMGQFRGLVDNCEFGTGDKPTTCTDLQVHVSSLIRGLGIVPM
jgi:hypothetical protein